MVGPDPFQPFPGSYRGRWVVFKIYLASKELFIVNQICSWLGGDLSFSFEITLVLGTGHFAASQTFNFVYLASDQHWIHQQGM